MKTPAILIMTIWAGTLAFAQTPATTETKPAPSEAKKPAEVAAPAAKSGQPVADDAAKQNASASSETNAASPNSIEYVSADLQDVLRTLARQAGLNIVLGEDVTGKVTVSLVDVPYEKAIKLIADSKGFAIVKEDNIIKVQSKATLAAEPLQEEIISLNYTTAPEAEKIIRPFLTQGRGSVQADPRSNTLIISDVPTKLGQIKEIVARIDMQTPQVMIEAKIIETTKNPKQDYGIKWDSLLNYEVAAKNMGWKFDLPPSPGSVIKPYPGGTSAGAPKDATVAVLTASDFKLVMSFLNSNGDSDLLASPRIVTANNKEAKINIATQFPIPQFTFNQQTASLEVSGFQFKDIGILLTVTPHINKSGYITLELKPEVSSFDPKALQTFGGSVQAQIPIIDTRNLSASVLIKDGHTLALGGLIREDNTRTFTKVPLMGDIPGLGAAFRSSSFEKKKKNLLIFITPTLVGPEGNTGYENQYNGVKGSTEDDFANPKGWRDNAFPKSEQKKRARDINSSK